MNEPIVLAPSAELTLQDLRVLAADGLIVRLFGESYVSTGAEPTPSVRAAAVAAMAAPGDVVGRETAVWVHCGALASPLVHVLVPGSKRHRRFRPDCCLHESRAGDDDLTTLAGLRLTTFHRSVFDVCAADLDAADGILTAVGHHLDVVAFDEYLGKLGVVPGRKRIRAMLRRRFPAALAPR